MATTCPNPAETTALLDYLACPACGAGPVVERSVLRCVQCGASYTIAGGVVDMRPPGSLEKPEAAAWTEHWSSGKQESFAQRFFSFYRKSVFARSVRYFLWRYFPARGMFVEAGSGTSETSMHVDKNGGARMLVALDLVIPVLERAHPVMDFRVCGDIFRMPFRRDSLDGIWNVGVMEHFLHPDIDRILTEFRRVLRPGGRVILLWPASYSIPQRMLRCLEFVINMRRRGERFRFHPDEISQLRSTRQGREVLARNGFRPVHIDFGFRTLMAFQTLVGEKPLHDRLKDDL
jgi:SAM-dependent methyltransferase